MPSDAEAAAREGGDEDAGVNVVVLGVVWGGGKPLILKGGNGIIHILKRER